MTTAVLDSVLDSVPVTEVLAESVARTIAGVAVDNGAAEVRTLGQKLAVAFPRAPEPFPASRAISPARSSLTATDS